MVKIITKALQNFLIRKQENAREQHPLGPAQVGGAFPASPHPAGITGKEPIGIELCLRQPIRDKHPLGLP